MVMMSSTLRGRFLKFHSQAVDPNTLLVRSFEGREAISHPYRVRLELVTKRRDLDSDALLRQPAFLGIKQIAAVAGSNKPGVRTHKIHGVLASVEEVGYSGEWVAYRALLVPRLWRLSLNVQSRVFQNKSVPEIVEEVLKPEVGKDVQLTLDGKRPYAKREYVVQYQESDLQFISRLLEHEGIFYVFEQAEEQEKIVFGDGKSALKPIQGLPEIQYNPKDHTGQGDRGQWFQDERILKWTYRHTAGSAEVLLREYNYRNPSVALEANHKAVDTGFGRIYEYGAHFKDAAEGKALAQVRSEELKAREKQFSGSGDARAFRAGSTFTLKDHPRPDYNRDYLLTSVSHMAKQDLGAGGYGTGTVSYANEFSCIASDVPFRPERVTPKPKVVGTIHARVDAAGDGTYAEIDDQGRYKVILPVDLAGKEGGTASRWIRMAQPYAGAEYGMHFPLHKGAEVLLTHIEGDPDRPIIAAAIPNPEKGSPVKAANQTQCVIRTGGGNELRIEDTDQAQWINLSTPGHTTFLNLGTEHHSIHVPHGASLGTKETVSISGAKGIHIAAGGSEHDDSIRDGKAGFESLQKWVVGGAAVGALAVGVAGDIATMAHGISIPAIAAIGADLVGGAMGFALSSIYMTTPGKIGAVATGELVLGGGLTADLISAGSANIIGLTGAMIIGGLEACVVSMGNVEAISVRKNVVLHAKKKDVKIEAHENVHLEAKKKDVGVWTEDDGQIWISTHKRKKLRFRPKGILISADEDFKIAAENGFGRVETKKTLVLSSLDEKVVILSAGKSKIMLKDDGIFIVAPKIEIQTSDAKAKLRLEKDVAVLQADSDVQVRSKDAMILNGKNSIAVTTKMWDGTAAKEVKWPDHVDK